MEYVADHWRNGIVPDPFAGSGTTLMVATGHGRDAIGIDPTPATSTSPANAPACSSPTSTASPRPRRDPDDYAGLGGWSEGLAMLRLADIGIEWDAAACATARRRGTRRSAPTSPATSRAPQPVAGGFLASPPCQTFSAAGSGAGRAVLLGFVAAVDGEDWSAIDRHDDRTRHVLIAARNALTLGAEWVALEQVPPVLPVWEAVARRLHPAATGRGAASWWPPTSGSRRPGGGRSSSRRNVPEPCRPWSRLTPSARRSPCSGRRCRGGCRWLTPSAGTARSSTSAAPGWPSDMAAP